jgi:flagellar basal-body rod modification protein FlgD
MPKIGRPQTTQQNRYRQVTMAPQQAKPSNTRPQQMSDDAKNELFEKISGKSVGVGKRVIDTTRKPKSQMGKDEFLKLLTFQLKNQDPLNPMEQNKFTAELAQFSQLEQLQNLNTKFDQTNKSADMKDKFYAASFLGKQVITRGQSINIEAGKGANLHFNLSQPAKNVVVRIFDEKGNVNGEVKAQNLAPGQQTLKWDGKALDGYEASPGRYAIQVYAWDQDAQRIPVETNAVGLVESVNFENGKPVLTVNGKRVSLEDVKSFHVAQKDLTLHNNNKQNMMAKKLPQKNAIKNFEQEQRSIYD